MGQLITPICDRCGQRGDAGHPFAQIKFISRTGTIRVQDLCWGCEALMEAWMDYHKDKDKGENGDGTD